MSDPLVLTPKKVPMLGPSPLANLYRHFALLDLVDEFRVASLLRAACRETDNAMMREPRRDANGKVVTFG